jgi:hypothetical protein
MARMGADITKESRAIIVQNNQFDYQEDNWYGILTIRSVEQKNNE